MAAPVSSAEEKKKTKTKQKQNKLIQLPKTLERKELALSDILLYKWREKFTYLCQHVQVKAKSREAVVWIGVAKETFSCCASFWKLLPSLADLYLIVARYQIKLMTLFQTKLKRISTLTLTDVSLAVIKLTIKNSLIMHNPLTYENTINTRTETS